MTKFLRILICLCVGMFLVSHVANAQLINYDRLKKINAQQQGLPAPATPATSGGYKRGASKTPQTPVWYRIAPQVRSRTEKRYDRNRDKRLQSSEVKALLNNVIKTVEQRGRYKIDSDILKIYDVNRNNIITRNELAVIKAHARLP